MTFDRKVQLAAVAFGALVLAVCVPAIALLIGSSVVVANQREAARLEAARTVDDANPQAVVDAYAGVARSATTPEDRLRLHHAHLQLAAAADDTASTERYLTAAFDWDDKHDRQRIADVWLTKADAAEDPVEALQLYDLAAKQVAHTPEVQKRVDERRAQAAQKRLADGKAALASAKKEKDAVAALPLYRDAISHFTAAESFGIPEGDLTKFYKEAAAGQDRGDCAVGAASREAVVPLLDQHFLDAGLDTKLRVSGTCKKTLRIEYILCSRVFLNELSKGQLATQLRGAGFNRIECYDGYDDLSYLTWE
jgi:hypothetical protein